jgi:hypothetical protein
MSAPAGGEERSGRLPPHPVRDLAFGNAVSAFSGVVIASRCAKGPPGVDLIRSPRRVGVLSDVWAGTTLQAGDLSLSLEGLGDQDRGCNVARTLGRFSGIGSLILEALGNAGIDSLVTMSEARSAELSTMPLRWRP